MSAATFGARLRELRKARGLTLKQLARRTRLHFSYISKIECGKTPPPREPALKRLAVALGYDAERLTLEAGKLPKWKTAEVAAKMLEWLDIMEAHKTKQAKP